MNDRNGARPPSSSAGNEADAALAGLRLVVLADGVAPTFAGRWFAAFGADVTVVEPPGGHWLRRYWPSGAAPEGDTGPLAAFLLAGASSVVLDRTRAEDRTALRALLAETDGLLHDLSPDVLAAWGLDAHALRAEQPELVQVAMTPFGADGPYGGFSATSIVLLALGGYQFLTGERGREPLMLPGFQPEYMTALYGISAALAGLVRRDRHGDGCAAEVVTIDALASLHQFTTSQWLYQQSIRTRHGNRWENLYPITMLPCRDGYLALSMPGPEMWQRLCLMIERPDLLEDPRFATPALRHAHADELDEILLEWLMQRDMMDLFATAQERWRLPVNPYYELPEVIADPQYQERGFWQPVPGDDGGPLQPGLPVRMSAATWRIGRAPHTGERAEVTAPSHARATPVRQPSAATPIDADDPTLPLAGVRVLDFTRVWSGPLCTRILADLGAEVIKVEAPFPRNAPPGAAALAGRPVAGPGKLSRNKHSLSIDLRRPEGRDLVKRLAARSDVLVENFSARVMPNFGLGYEALREVNPGLIMLAMSGYGATGPYREYLCYGSATESMTGMTALLGYPGEEPLNSAIAYPDAIAGLSGAATVLTALVQRGRSGRGQFIDLSQIEPATAMWGEYFLEYQMTGQLPARTGNRHPYWAPHGTYPCRGEDQWISIAVRSDEEWQRLRELASLTDDAHFANATGRIEHRHHLDALIAAWTAGQQKFELMQRLQHAGIPAGAVLDARELVENAHLAHRRFFVNAAAPEGGAFPMPGTPIAVDGRRRDHWRAAPFLGEHNRDVLTTVLGLDDAEIERLIEAGVLAGGGLPSVR